MGWMCDASGGDFGPSILMLIAIALVGLVAYRFTLKREAAEAVHSKQAERLRAV